MADFERINEEGGERSSGGEFVKTVVTGQIRSQNSTDPAVLLQVYAGSKEWSSNIGDCCADKKICLCGTFCPLCYACYLYSHVGENPCVAFLGGSAFLRQKIRMMLGIKGSICGDICCLVWPCVGPCTYCQLAREIKSAGFLSMDKVSTS